MGINTESNVTATLQIGPTTEGMVRLFVQTDTAEIPFDFDPEEAEDIANEIMAAVARAKFTKPNQEAKKPRRKKRKS